VSRHSRDEPNNLLHLPKTTRNTSKTANKLMIVASAEINLQSKHHPICHLGKEKAATLAHSVADVSAFIIPFESNASIRPKENVFYPQQRKQYP